MSNTEEVCKRYGWDELPFFHNPSYLSKTKQEEFYELMTKNRPSPQPITLEERADIYKRMLSGQVNEQDRVNFQGNEQSILLNDAGMFGSGFYSQIKRDYEKEYRERVINGPFYSSTDWMFLKFEYDGGCIVPYEKPWVEFMPYQRRAMFAELKVKVAHMEHMREVRRSEAKEHAKILRRWRKYNRSIMLE